MRELARLIATLLSLYSLAIIVRIIMQYLTIYRQSSGQSDFALLLARITDPYLNIFKRINVLRKGALDFSPLAALALVSITQRLFQMLALSAKLTFGFILATIIQTIWSSIISLLLGVFAIFIGIRLYLSYKRTAHSIIFISHLDSYLKRPMDFVHSLLFGSKEVSDRTLLWSVLAITAAVYVLGAILVGISIKALLNLPW
ncbi:MAG: YggT family protein [Sphaerochaetaceae bacterium]